MNEDDIRMIDQFEAYLNEALRLILEEEAKEQFTTTFTPLQEQKQADIASLERARYVWLLRGSLVRLTTLAKQSGWLTRSTKDWYSLLFFSCFASLPTRGCELENCPTYPAHRMLKTANAILDEPNNYHPLLAAFRYQQMTSTGRKS